MTPALKLHLFPPGLLPRLWSFLGSAALGVYRDDCLGTAKGVAYSALLAFFPVLTTLAAILFQVKADATSRTIAHLLYDVVPPGTAETVKMLFVVHGARPQWVLISAILLALWAASGAIVSLIEGFRAIYRTHDARSFLLERLLSMFLVFTSLLPVLGASALIVFGNRLERSVIGWIGLSNPSDASELAGWVKLGGLGLRFLVAFGAIVAASSILYYFGPERKQSFRQILPGAVVATILWLLATVGFGWYVRHIVDYNVLYGGVGAGLALLVWMYVLAVILFFGCEFNSEREKAALRVPI